MLCIRARDDRYYNEMKNDEIKKKTIFVYQPSPIKAITRTVEYFSILLSVLKFEFLSQMALIGQGR